jgi:PAS domain S-box-containing protein
MTGKKEFGKKDSIGLLYKHDYYAFILIISLLIILIFSYIYMSLSVSQNQKKKLTETLSYEAALFGEKLQSEIELYEHQLLLLSDLLTHTANTSLDREFKILGEALYLRHDALLSIRYLDSDFRVQQTIPVEREKNQVDDYPANQKQAIKDYLTQGINPFLRAPYYNENNHHIETIMYSVLSKSSASGEPEITGLLLLEIDLTRVLLAIRQEYQAEDLSRILTVNGNKIFPDFRKNWLPENLNVPLIVEEYSFSGQDWQLFVSPTVTTGFFTSFNVLVFIIWLIIIVLITMTAWILYRYTLSEVSSRKKREQLVQENEKRFRTLFEIVPEIPIIGYDQERKVIFWNEACELLYGYSKDKALGRKIEDLIIKPEEKDTFVRKFTEHLTAGSSMPAEETIHCNQEGSAHDVLSVHIRMENISGIPEFYTVDLEITPYKEAARSLESEKDTILSLFDIINEILYVSDLDTGEVLLINKFTEKLIQQGVSGRKCLQELAENRDPVLSFGIKNTPQPNGTPIKLDYHELENNRHYLITENLIDWKNGKKAKFTILTDVTEFKQRELSLQDTKDRLYSTLESIGEGLIATDTKGKVSFMNKVAQELTGWAWEEAKGKDLEKILVLIDEKTNRPLEKPLLQSIGTNTILGVDDKPVILAKDQEKRVAEIVGAPILNEENTILGDIILLRDVTTKRRIEEKVIKSRKLESLGTLAAGVAYDFNNLLSSLFGYIEMAMVFHNSQEKVSQYLSRALGIYEKATGLTDKLITFSRRSTPDRKTMSVKELLEETAQFAVNGSKTRYQLKLEHDLWLCDIDRTQIQQVFSNLMINSVQAMPDGGTITIKGENIPSSSAPVWTGRTSNYVKITIADEGAGIPKDCLEKIFDPFFTTKHQGSGLGLAIAYSIIDKHNGCIDVSSVSEVGTTFEVYLPASGKRTMDETQNETTAHTDAKILIMDDDPIVTDTIKETLEDIGCTVMLCSSGSKALLIYEEEYLRGKPFDLVIFDLTVPGELGGLETLQLLREKYPDIVALASSGYLDNPVMAEPNKYGFYDKVEKPYHLEEFIELIQKVLKDISE